MQIYESITKFINQITADGLLERDDAIEYAINVFEDADGYKFTATHLEADPSATYALNFPTHLMGVKEDAGLNLAAYLARMATKMEHERELDKTPLVC